MTSSAIGQSDLPARLLADLLADPLVGAIFCAARECGGEARIVGGAVRDICLNAEKGKKTVEGDAADTPDRLAGTAPDIDMAVSLPIEVFAAEARHSGLAVYDTGLAHGTVTVRAENRQIEVTQLRIDHDQDGRHARIEATGSWEQDAQRRDFTMNALYLDEQGVLYDPVGGLADITARQLRFIGKADNRLAEDYLRLLRGLRFCAQYPELWMEDKDRAAMGAAIAGLAGLSAERIASELRKLCAGAGAEAMILEMQALSIDRALFNQPLIRTSVEWEILRDIWPYLDFVARLGMMFSKGQCVAVVTRLKCSRQDIKQARRIDAGRPEALQKMLGTPAWQQAVYHLSPEAVFAYGEAALAGLLAPDQSRLRHIASFQLPRCPVKGGDIKRAFGLDGPDISRKLTAIEAEWVASNFTLTAKELLGVGKDK